MAGLSEPIRPLPEVLEAGWSEGRLDRPQGWLRYATAGQGPPLVLCHGFIGSAENFETWVPRLAGRCRLVIPDLPGFGSSDPLPERHTSRALASEVVALTERLGVERYRLGGLCLGADVALEVLAMAPRRVEALLLHTPLLDPGMLRTAFRWQVTAGTTRGLFELVSMLGRRRWLADLYRRMAVEGNAAVDRRAAEVNFRNQVRASPRAAREWLRESLHLQFTDLLGGWTGPVAVLAAGDDRILNLARLARFCAARPNTTLDVIAAAGHGWTEEFMARQLLVLERFLDEGAAAGAA